MKLRLSPSLTKYLVAGVAAFTVEYVSFYILFIDFEIKLFIANSASFLLGLLTSFTINRVWTFGDKHYSKRATHQLSIYFALAVVNLLLTNIIVELLVKMNVTPSVGKLAAMVITSLWNYSLFKIIIFTHKATS